MSVVACRITKDGFEIAADSISIRGATQSRGQNTTRSKLIEVNNMVIGSVGFSEESSLLRLFASTNHPSRPEEGAILEFLSEFSSWKNKKTGKSDIKNSYFIAYEGIVFGIQHWFIQEIVTYDAIGAGRDFALAALYLGHDATKAVETAIELSIYCEAPVQLIEKKAKKSK